MYLTRCGAHVEVYRDQSDRGLNMACFHSFLGVWVRLDWICSRSVTF